MVVFLVKLKPFLSFLFSFSFFDWFNWIGFSRRLDQNLKRKEKNQIFHGENLYKASLSLDHQSIWTSKSFGQTSNWMASSICINLFWKKNVERIRILTIFQFGETSTQEEIHPDLWIPKLLSTKILKIHLLHSFSALSTWQPPCISSAHLRWHMQQNFDLLFFSFIIMTFFKSIVWCSQTILTLFVGFNAGYFASKAGKTIPWWNNKRRHDHREELWICEPSVYCEQGR